MKALVVNCTCKAFPELSNMEALASVITDAGDGDEWPPVHAKLLDSKILIIAAPTWLGQPSPVERALSAPPLRATGRGRRP